MFLNQLKTNYLIGFLQNGFKYKKNEFTTLFKEISPQELNKCLQKFYLQENAKAISSLRAKFVIVGSSNWVKNPI